MENWRHPSGESQVLDPRPRPVSWNVARETIGVGRDVKNRGFLGEFAPTIFECERERGEV